MKTELHTLNMNHETISDNELPYQLLCEDKNTEILIIGSCLTSLTMAYCLAKSGREVIVIANNALKNEFSLLKRVHISYAPEVLYHELQKRYGFKDTKLIAESYKETIKWIQSTAQIENIDCDLQQVSGFVMNGQSKIDLYKELYLTRKLRLNTKLFTNTTLPGFVGKRNFLHYPKQAQLDLKKYKKGLFKAVKATGCHLFLSSESAILTNDGININGHFITARQVIQFAGGKETTFSLDLKQSDFLKSELRAKIPKGQMTYGFWQEIELSHKPKYFVSLEKYDINKDLLISVCEQEDDCPAEREQKIELHKQWNSENLTPFIEYEKTSISQVKVVETALPVVKVSPDRKNFFSIQAISENNILLATLTALMITNVLDRQKRRWKKIFALSCATTPANNEDIQEITRQSMLKAKNWLDWDLSLASNILNGCGKVIGEEVHNIALYRDYFGKLHSFNGNCPHSGSTLHWNNLDKVFQCPVDGSRFTALGILINGPANRDMQKK
jgi:glycine/D-amino acid oxidase-like deaminating enzyme/nitrite reductase/ring-hydroxylating ferredoxin subunit